MVGKERDRSSGARKRAEDAVPSLCHRFTRHPTSHHLLRESPESPCFVSVLRGGPKDKKRKRASLRQGRTLISAALRSSGPKGSSQAGPTRRAASHARARRTRPAKQRGLATSADNTTGYYSQRHGARSRGFARVCKGPSRNNNKLARGDNVCARPRRTSHCTTGSTACPIPSQIPVWRSALYLGAIMCFCCACTKSCNAQKKEQSESPSPLPLPPARLAPRLAPHTQTQTQRHRDTDTETETQRHRHRHALSFPAY